MKLGVFDSGVGGLTVVRALRASYPGADILYLGDTARVPYGTKSAQTVERYALRCQSYLLEHEVDLILIACNTASATAVHALRDAAPCPVIGAVEPGALRAKATSTTGHIGVLATLGTVRSEAYPKALLALDPTLEVHAQACPLFVPLAEEGWTHGDVPEKVAERYLQALFAEDPQIDTLVLGCTHYPLLRDCVASVAQRIASHPVHLVDSAEAMALSAAPYFQSEHPGQGSLVCVATDATRLDELALRFLGEVIGHVDIVDL